MFFDQTSQDPNHVDRKSFLEEQTRLRQSKELEKILTDLVKSTEWTAAASESLQCAPVVKPQVH